MKLTLKERIANSKELLLHSDFNNCMHRNDMDVVFYASAMVGSCLDRRHNDILMNRNAVPRRWHSNSYLSDCRINSAVKKAYAQVVEYLEQGYNITTGRMLKLLDIFISERHQDSKVIEDSKFIKDFSDKILLDRYLRKLNDLRMYYTEMTNSEIYDFSFDMVYDFIDTLSLSEETLFMSLMIMYWIQRENDLIPLALICDKDEFISALDARTEDTHAIKKEKKKIFRHLMRKSLDLHLKMFIKKASKDSAKHTSRERIIELIKINPKHTAKTMASCLGLSVPAIQKQIAFLKSENKLERVGPDKGGRWKVIEKTS